MASFDALFKFRAQDRPIVVACIAAARRRSRTFGVRIRSELSKENYGYIFFNGQTYALDILLERLRRDLPTIAEATPCERTPRDRRRVANGFVDILNRYRGGLYERYEETWVPTLRAKRTAAYSLPHQLFPFDAPSLQHRLFVTEDMLASWHYDEVAPEVLIEEIHTAAELLLEASVNRRSKRLSFAQLVDAAHQRKLLRAYPTDDVWPPEVDPAGTLEDHCNDFGRVLLLDLKNHRKEIRHRGAPGASDWLAKNFWPVVSLLEHLAIHAKDAV